MSGYSNKPNKLMQTFLAYVEKYRERETYLTLMLSTQPFDDYLGPLDSMLAPSHSLHVNTCKRYQKTIRDTREHILYIKHKLLDK